MRFLVSTNDFNYSRVIRYYKGIVLSRELNKEYIPFKERAMISDNDLEKITELYFSYQYSYSDLEGIDELINLKMIKIAGAIGDMTSLLGCKNLEEIYIGDSSLIYDLECLIRHPKLKIIKLGGFPQYSKEYFEQLVEIFKTKNIELSNDNNYDYSDYCSSIWNEAQSKKKNNQKEN